MFDPAPEADPISPSGTVPTTSGQGNTDDATCLSPSQVNCFVHDVLALFRERLERELAEVAFAEGESPSEVRACGEVLVRTYMDQAPSNSMLPATSAGFPCRATSMSSTSMATSST